MALIDLVYELLKTDLCAPRVFLPQVSHYITEHYGYAASEFEAFFREKYPSLEDYEVDLIFSPQFTPAEHNRMEYIPLLGEKALTKDEIRHIKQRLAGEKLEVTFKDAESPETYPIPVHEVFIDRYVDLLKLDQALPAQAHDVIVSQVPQESWNETNLLARDEVWQGAERADILFAFLKAFHRRQSFSVQKLRYLTDFIRTYRPAGLIDLSRQFDSLIESCRNDMDNVTGQRFHDEYLKALYAHNEHARAGEGDVFEHYKRMMELAQQLKDDYQAIPNAAPDIWERARQQQPV